MVRCTSDTRERMLEVIKAYTAKLQQRKTSSIPQSMLATDDVLTPDKLRALAITLARDAFKAPRTYYFDVSDGVPTHCLHLDLLTEQLFQTSVAWDSFADKYFNSTEQLMWMFLDHTSVDELQTIPSEVRLGEIARTIAKQPNSVAQNIAAQIRTVSCSDADELIVFGSARVSKSKVMARLFAILFVLFEMFDTVSWMSVLSALGRTISIAPNVRLAMNSLLSTLANASVAQRMLEHALTHLAVTIGSVDADGPRHDAALAVEILFDANFSSRRPLLSHTQFYFPLAQEFDLEEIKEDFIRERKGSFALMHYPCLLDAGYKSALLQIEAHVEYAGAMRNAMLSSVLNSQLQRGQLDARNFFLTLRVKRLDLVATSLKELQLNISNLRKPLRVVFEGEEGVDEGGLRKEFFQLLCKELLSPDHGMFASTPDNRLWLVSDQKNDFNRREFWLVGMVIGLAVFNNIVLDVSFPMVLFRKLLGLPVSFEDLEFVDAELYRGLCGLLNFEEREGLTVEDSYCRNFEFTEDIFGATVSTELCPGGRDIPLTIHNRDEYVRLMTDHILGRMISTNFGEFKKGFDQVCARGLIQQKKVRPEELELLVCGRPDLDLKALEEATSYDGFEKSDAIIQSFWDVVHNFSSENKKSFLKFCTGSDRVPVRGLSDLNFVIGKNGDNEEMLPTAHTCFNHLLLPAYSSREVLEAKLLLAIQNCEGFGLR